VNNNSPVRVCHALVVWDPLVHILSPLIANMSAVCFRVISCGMLRLFFIHGGRLFARDASGVSLIEVVPVVGRSGECSVNSSSSSESCSTARTCFSATAGSRTAGSRITGSRFVSADIRPGWTGGGGKFVTCAAIKPGFLDGIRDRVSGWRPRTPKSGRVLPSSGLSIERLGSSGGGGGGGLGDLFLTGGGGYTSGLGGNKGRPDSVLSSDCRGGIGGGIARTPICKVESRLSLTGMAMKRLSLAGNCGGSRGLVVSGIGGGSSNGGEAGSSSGSLGGVLNGETLSVSRSIDRLEGVARVSLGWRLLDAGYTRGFTALLTGGGIDDWPEDGGLGDGESGLSGS
jgi:hypothetical protein